RVAAADAGVAADTARADDVQREALGAVARAYFSHERAQERRELLAEAQATAEEIQRAAQRRFVAGDVAAVGVNLSTAPGNPAPAATIAGEADLVVTAGVLARLLGVESAAAIDVDHALEDERAASLPTLLAAVESRPDLQALNASLAEAEADVRLGHAAARP